MSPLQIHACLDPRGLVGLVGLRDHHNTRFKLLSPPTEHYITGVISYNLPFVSKLEVVCLV